jgi:hypothetical protein
MKQRPSYLRPKGARDGAKVTMVELLFDLAWEYAALNRK